MFVLAHVAARGGVCGVYVGFLCTCMHAFCCVAFVPFGLGRSSFLFFRSCCRSPLSALFFSSPPVCGSREIILVIIVVLLSSCSLPPLFAVAHGVCVASSFPLC